jgi:hypothetical protein
MSLASLLLSPEEIFQKDWIEEIIQDYGNDAIKYDVDKTNELYNFILQNLRNYTQCVQFTSDYFFISSCFIYTFPWKLNNSYTAIQDGLLYENSANCKFTISNINGRNTFVKVVNARNVGADYIILDIMNCILLEILYEKIKLDATRTQYYNTPDIFTNYSLTDFVNRFDASFASYSSPTHWNYNKLMDEKYIYSNFCQITQNPDYTRKCHIYMTNAINGKPETLRSLFEAYQQDQTVIITITKYFNSLKHVYNYIYYMGFNYGFLHNDLHQGNLLFDTHIEKLTIIDYGRNYIGYFYDNRYEYIDNCVKNYYKILNYENVYGVPQIINTYKDMIDIYQYSNSLKSVIKSSFNNGYMTHILDIITLSLVSLYYIDLLHNYYHVMQGAPGNTQYDPTFLRLTNLIYFKKLNGANNYDALLNKNIKISLRNSSFDIYKIIDTYILTKLDIIKDIVTRPELEYHAFIYDGLFYTALLFNYYNIDGDDISHRHGGDIFFKAFQIIKNSRLVTQYKINDFMTYLNYVHQDNRYLSVINIYFKKMGILQTPNPISRRIRGGEETLNIFPSKIRSTTPKYKKITQEMQEVIDRLERNDKKPIEPSFTAINEEIMKSYENIFINK